MTDKSKCLVILSGGQDSTTCLFWAVKHYEEVHAITFNYGQRHQIEIEAAITVARMAGIQDNHFIKHIPPELLSSKVSPLTNPNAKLEQYESYDQMDKVIGDRVELTFVPYRNLMFLVIAANHAAAIGISHLVVGVCQEDNANYPDCRQSFINQTQATLNYAIGLENAVVDPSETSSGSDSRIVIHAPLMNRSKSDSVVFASMLPGCMEALAYSHTSYDGKYPPVDMNHANVLRANGFEQACLPDPLVVRAWKEGLMELPVTGNYDRIREESQLKQKDSK